jgi:hypothetical protein
LQDGSPTSKTFEHIPSEIGAEEAEEVGVEHLLRDIKDTTVGTLSQRITNQLLGLKGLHEQIREIRDYLLQACFLIEDTLSFNITLIDNYSAKSAKSFIGWQWEITYKSSNRLSTSRHLQFATRHDSE